MAGIYIHIPFCKQACTYCNFHFSTSLKQKDAFIEALKREIQLQDSFINPQEEIGTIYFGGGTPGILPVEDISAILDEITKKFTVAKKVECTLEANPDDITPQKTTAWKHAGINRLSIGIQSFDDSELKWMNRAHTAGQSLKSLKIIRDAGFENYTIDLIYGSPYQSNEQLKKNLQQVFANGVPHISCYALTLEAKTALAHQINKQTIASIDYDKQAEQFELLQKLMDENGYEQYEISNFALPGFKSRHNSSYWQGKSYYGFGPSAHSFNGKNTRRWNVANNALYIQSLQQNTIPFEEEILTPVQQLNERIMTGLRTIEGVDLLELALIFGNNKKEVLVHNAQKFISAGKMEEKDNFLSLTKKGKFLADGIAADLFFD